MNHHTDTPKENHSFWDRALCATSLAACVAVSMAIGTFIGRVTRMGMADGWYDQLAKSPLTPPDWVFGAVWGVLYAGLGYVAWVLWAHRDSLRGRVALLFFGIQMILNWAWSFVFFVTRYVDVAAVWIGVLILFATAALIKTRPLSLPAFAVMAVYTAWLCFALYLNVQITLLR